MFIFTLFFYFTERRNKSAIQSRDYLIKPLFNLASIKLGRYLNMLLSRISIF